MLARFQAINGWIGRIGGLLEMQVPFVRRCAYNELADEHGKLAETVVYLLAKLRSTQDEMKRMIEEGSDEAKAARLRIMELEHQLHASQKNAKAPSHHRRAQAARNG